jgi:Poly-beta-hydroxybutyrate polymerase N terminal
MTVPDKSALAASAKSTSASPIAALADVRYPSNVTSSDLDETTRVALDAGDRSRTKTVEDRDTYAVTAFADIVDRSSHAALARLTMGLSPAAFAEAYLDWAIHLTFSTGKRLQLMNKGTKKAIRFVNLASQCALRGDKAQCCIEPLPDDRRFAGADWQRWPYNFIYQAFLLNQQW